MLAINVSCIQEWDRLHGCQAHMPTASSRALAAAMPPYHVFYWQCPSCSAAGDVVDVALATAVVVAMCKANSRHACRPCTMVLLYT
jgi:hypothetical protein